MNYVSIETAQNVEIRFPKASFAERLVAHIIDGVVVTVSLVAIIFTVSIVSALVSRGGSLDDASSLAVGISFTLSILIFVFYTPVMETIMKGQTIGKKAMKIRVVRLDGSQAGVGNYLLRWVIGIFEINFFMGVPAIIAIVASKSGQRLGDMVAGTTVVKLTQAVSLDSIYIGARETSSVTYPGVDVLTERDIETIREVLASTRRGNLDPHKAVELLYATRDQVARALNVPSTGDPELFLTTVIADWTTVMGRTGQQF